jgi:hypothetical protein
MPVCEVTIGTGNRARDVKIEDCELNASLVPASLEKYFLVHVLYRARRQLRDFSVETQYNHVFSGCVCNSGQNPVYTAGDRSGPVLTFQINVRCVFHLISSRPAVSFVSFDAGPEAIQSGLCIN